MTSSTAQSPGELPSRANGYAVAIGQAATREFFEAFLSDIHLRLNDAEGKSAAYDEAIDLITTTALAVVAANISGEVERQRASLEAIEANAEEIAEVVEQLRGLLVPASNITLAPIAGLAASRVQTAIEFLVASKADAAAFETLAGILTGRVDTAIAAIDTRALILSQALALMGTR